MASIFYLLLYYFIYFIYYNSAISRSRDKKYYVLDIYIYIYIKVRYNNFCVSQYFFLLSLITIRSLLHETSILLKRTLFFFFLFFLRSLLFFFNNRQRTRIFFTTDFPSTIIHRPTSVQFWFRTRATRDRFSSSLPSSHGIVHRSSTLQIVLARLTVGEINVDETSTSCLGFRDDFTSDLLEFLLLLLLNVEYTLRDFVWYAEGRGNLANLNAIRLARFNSLLVGR